MIEIDSYFAEKLILLLKGNLTYDKESAINALQLKIDADKKKVQFKHATLNDAFIHEKKPKDYEEIINIANRYIAGNKS